MGEKTNIGRAGLRVVDDETPPLSLDELQSRGNALLADARRAAVAALHASTTPELFGGNYFTPTQVKRLHQRAKDAAAAWAQVEAALAELVCEFDRSNNTARRRP